MIIDIALGIVLAVIILRLLPDIIELGISILYILLVLAIAGFLISWTISWTIKNADSVITFLVIVLTIIVGIKVAQYIERKTVLNRDEAGALTIFSIVSGLTAFSAALEVFSEKPKELTSAYLPMVIGLGILGCYLIFAIRKRIKQA